MATLTPSTTSRTAIDLPTAAASAAGGGDKFANDGTQLLYVENTNASTVTVTVAVQQTVDGLSVTNKTFTVAQNERKLIGPFSPNVYNDASGFVNLTYTAVTNLKVLPVKMGST